MVEIHPMRIPGRWEEGFVLDYHTVSSIYLGDDLYGRPVFDTTRTEIGELLFRLKFRSDNSVASEIAGIIADFLVRWNPDIELIIPVPPSSPRNVQPVFVIAERLGERLGIPAMFDCVARTKEMPAIKNIYDYEERVSLLEDAHEVVQSSAAGKRVLLFDDLYRSGATMNSIADVLYNQGNVAAVYGLAITRTRRNR